MLSFLWTLGGGETEGAAQYLWDDAPHPAGSAVRSVTMAVEDMDLGSPRLERVFEAGFTTRAGEIRGRSRSIGLGLSIVRELVEEAGGTVRAVVRL